MLKHSVVDYFLENKGWLHSLVNTENHLLRALAKAVIDSAESEIMSQKISGEKDG